MFYFVFKCFNYFIYSTFFKCYKTGERGSKLSRNNECGNDQIQNNILSGLGFLTGKLTFEHEPTRASLSGMLDRRRR